MSSLKRYLADDILQCEICVEDFNCKDRGPYQCVRCTNYPICEICYKKSCTNADGSSKPMICPQCHHEGPFNPDRTILKIATSMKKKKEHNVNWRNNLCLNNVIPIEKCLSLGQNPSLSDLYCMNCGTNFADAYCEDEEPNSQAFFLCNECKPNRPMRQVVLLFFYVY